MLDVEGGDDVDTGVEHFDHILPALEMARARHIGVSQLIDQRQLRPAGEHGVEIELVEILAAIGDGLARQNLEAGHQPFGLGAPMRLDQADNDIDALARTYRRLLQHGVGLAHPGRGTEENLQPAPHPAVGFGEERVRRWAVRLCGYGFSASSARLRSSTLTCGSPNIPRAGG